MKNLHKIRKNQNFQKSLPQSLLDHSKKDYLVQMSANLNRNWDLRYNLSEIQEFGIFSVKLVKILRIIGLRDLRWSKYYRSSWFVTSCEFLNLKYMYSLFYNSEYTILVAKFVQNLLWESMYGDLKFKQLYILNKVKFWHSIESIGNPAKSTLV